MVAFLEVGQVRPNILSSLVVFIVSLPLSIAIAVASGMPPSAGIISACVGGMIVGTLAGAPLTVSGPAAGLTAIVVEILLKHHAAGLAVVTVLAGALQLALGMARMGRIFIYIPRVVLEGVLSAIGLIIVLRQVPIFFGLPAPATNLEALQAPFIHPPVVAAVLLGCLTLIIQWVWSRWVERFDWIPAALPAVLIATLAGVSLAVPRIHLDSLFPYALHGRQIFLEGWHTLKIAPLLSSIVTVAIVASAETLLTARSVDLLMTSRKDYVPSQLNIELRAQGLGNMIAGVFGGTPLTAVMVRSAANIGAGATSRLSTILHGFWIGVFVLCFPAALGKIPLTVLAAVLLVIGFKLINFRSIYNECRERPLHGAVWIVTMATVISTDLLIGMIVGIILSLLTWWMDKIQTHEPPNRQTGHT